ncbi:antitoxin [Bifidobacterium sp. DSM 109958]|uniref:Antitoxin n=1 Tax=Bifidobacterium moraviense TaxID=2675323 RepID=A0A7Y0I076_9BIFI|nr:HepT-like ribonuclease domain-containing protein [Bifidobacterium sp. DSM 109958]NMN01178.1 antitoxin [Bifidobacterium sp. DSM 109958]
MKDSERDELLLDELIEHLQYAHDDVSAFDRAEDLALSRKDRNSAAKEIEQAQECASRLSDASLAAMTDVPWRELRGLRNVIVHEYGDVDWDVLYDTVMIDFPPVIGALRRHRGHADRSE